MSSICVRTLAICVLVLLAGCSDEPPSAQDQIRQLVNEFEQAVEQAEIRALSSRFHPDYQDPRHQSAREAIATLFLLRRRQRSLHLFTVVRSIDVQPGEHLATAVVIVAAAGVPITGTDALVTVDADLFRFDVDLIRESDAWRVRSSQWRRVSAESF